MWPLIARWASTPWRDSRLLHNFVHQEFNSLFAGSFGGLVWLFVTPVVNIIIFSFVFSVIFRVPMPEEFGDTPFVIYLMVAYLPWFAFSEAIGRSPGMLLEKAPLITKVMFPVQIVPMVGTVIPYIVHGVALLVLLVYLAMQGYLAWTWLWVMPVLFLQMLFTLGLAAALSALCVFLRDTQQIVALMLTAWFFLTPIIYPISMIPEQWQWMMVFNPMHSFMQFYREAVLLGEFSLHRFQIIAPVSLITCLLGGWFFMRIRHAFGDVL